MAEQKKQGTVQGSDANELFVHGDDKPAAAAAEVLPAVRAETNLNPFARAQDEKGTALVETQSAREMTEVQSRMVIAKKFPRDQSKAMDLILNACQRPGLAEKSLYVYSRGGTEIAGPSIRLAEAMAQAWGNLEFGVREIEQRQGESTVEAFAWDLETNTRQVKVFQVSHIRTSKRGSTMLTDPRDIYEMVANNGARRVRACILGIIPGDVTEAAVAQCDKTLATKTDVTPERIKSMVAAFADSGVTLAMIEKRIQRHLDKITPAQFVSLGKILNSMKDGMSTVETWFEAEQAAAPTGNAEKIRQAARKQE